MTQLTARAISVTRAAHRIHAEVVPGPGAPVILMHGFPDNLHLYDALMPHLVGRAPVVRFDFLGWGRSDKPAGYPYTATNQVGDITAVIDAVSAQLGTDKVTLVAHDASGPPAIDWALENPGRVQRLVLLNTYYNRTAGLKRPPAIALYSTPLLRNAARAAVRLWPGLDRRMFTWQVGKFIQDPAIRGPFVAKLYEQFDAARPGVLAAQRRPPRHGHPRHPAGRSAAQVHPARADCLRRQGSLPQPTGGPPLRRTVPAQRIAPAARRRALRPGRRTATGG